MTSLLGQTQLLKSKKQKGFIPYFVAGYPDLASLPLFIKAAAEAGAAAIEVGIPFSDPVADGPVLQKASFEALELGITLDEILATLGSISKIVCVPIILMGYMNPFLQKGWDRLAKEAKEAGVSGFIVADLPLEEAAKISNRLRSYDLGFNPLCAPTTNQKRMKELSKLCTGFVYLVALKGVTGSRAGLSDELFPFIDEARKAIDKPLYVGFGLSSPQQAAEVCQKADGVILGSRIATFLEENRNQPELDKLLKDYLIDWTNAIGGKRTIP